MSTSDSHIFRIAGHTIRITFQPSVINNMELLPAFSTFATADSTVPLLFSLTVDDTLSPAPDRQLVRKFDTGNGDTLVYMLPDGGYQFIIRDTLNRNCCLLIANHDFTTCRCALNGDWVMRSFGLNDALMLIFAFAGSFHQTLLIHASCVMLHDTAYPFIAESGTGKSTHASLWLRHIEGCELLNDDNPVVRILDDGQPRIYGSPWSGKTPCYRDRSARLGAVTRIERAPANKIVRQHPVQAFASLLPACSSMKWDATIYNNICNTVTRIIETAPVYTLYCLPDKEAAFVCHQTLTKPDSRHG